MNAASQSPAIDVPPLDLRATVAPGSINAEDRSFEVIVSTGAPVQRGGFFSEPYIESLAIEKKAIRMGRLNDGAPFLNAHSAYDVADVLGVIVPDSARVAGGQLLARVRMSKREAVEPVWQDIRDGILRNVSVGYRVHKYEQTEATDGAPMKRHATDWEPYEVSAVPMPADNGAKVRADQPQTNPCVIVTRTAQENAAMSDEHRAADSTLLPPPTPTVVVPAAAPEPEPPSDGERATAAERERIQGILKGCQAAKLSMRFAQQLIDAGTTLVEARGQILDAIGGPDHNAGPRPGPSGAVVVEGGRGVVQGGLEPYDHIKRGIQNALLAKIAPQYFKLEEIGQPYQSRSALAFVELCLHHRGISTTGWTKNELASAALGYGTRGSGFHTTSDFSNILIDGINKVLRAAYLQAAQTFDPFTRRMTLSDFKTLNLVQMGEAPALLEVKENGEFTRGTITDAKETMRLKTYGRVFSITRQALINDDLNAFGEVPTAFAKSARQKESDLVWEQITSNPTMGDGNALFSTQHGNLDSTGNAIDDTVIGEGFAAMRIQKGLDASTYLNIVPRILVVPVAKEAVALKYTSVITPATGATVNPYASRLSVVTEPRLDTASTQSWYLLSSKEDLATVGLAFLDGQDTPMVETKIGFEIDGIEIKCRHDVTAKALDWRGAFKNVGA